MFLIAYVVGQEANCNANDEDGPEDVKTLQNHQEAIEKVVAEEGFVDGHRVNPRTVNNPSAEQRLRIFLTFADIQMLISTKQKNV